MSNLKDKENLPVREGFYVFKQVFPLEYDVWYAYTDKTTKKWMIEDRWNKIYQLIPEKEQADIEGGTIHLNDFYRISLADIANRLQSALEERNLVFKHTSPKQLGKAVKEEREMLEKLLDEDWSDA